MVEAQEKINATWSRSAKNYNDIIDDELNSFRAAAWKEQILSNAPQKEKLKILDCGCGPGFFATIMAEEGHEVYAIDGSDVMMEYARARAKEHNLRIECLKKYGDDFSGHRDKPEDIKEQIFWRGIPAFFLDIRKRTLGGACWQKIPLLIFKR